MNFSFGHPERLLLLIVPLAIIIWEFRRRGPRLTLPFDHGQQGRGHWLARLVLSANLLPALILAIGVLLFSRPLVAEQPEAERTLTNIEFVMDVSGSMTSPFGEGSRYDASMRAIDQFTTRRKGDAFGLTIFGNEVLRWTPLTRDLAAIRSATPFLRPENLPGQFGGTEIGKALRFSMRTLAERGDGDKLLILLSDGESADLGEATSRQLGAELAENQIVLQAIHIGDGSPPTDLQFLTRPTRGGVFAAGTPQALEGVFETIDRMQPVKLKPTAAQPVDRFAPFAWAGLGLLSMYVLSLWGVRFTPW